MKYEVKIHMRVGIDCDGFDTVEDRFQSAVACSKTSIESILYDYPVEVDMHKNVITIELKQPTLFTENELRKKLRPAFCDTQGNVYPEFDVIKIQKI